MSYITTLRPILQAHLNWHPSRIRFLILFLTALVKVTTVNMAKIANVFSVHAKTKSHYRRIQRFLALCEIDYTCFARLLLALMPGEPNDFGQRRFVVSIDRTNWKFGRFDINILMAAIVHDGTAFPITWHLLPGCGSSNVDDRTELIDALLKVLPAERIEVLVADREFIGALWLHRLSERNISFAVRIRGNNIFEIRGRRRAVSRHFSRLEVGQRSMLRKPYRLMCQMLYLSAVRTEKTLIIVASNRAGMPALDLYQQRWGIEVLFASLKRRGFDFERTHLRHRARVRKLVALLALAHAWAYHVGLWRASRSRIAIKNHGRRARSIFRTGLDYLQHVLLHEGPKSAQVQTCLGLLADPLIVLLLEQRDDAVKLLKF